MPAETPHSPIGRDVILLHDLCSALLPDPRDGLEQVCYPDMSEDIVLGALIKGVGQSLGTVAHCVLQRSACPAGFGSCGPGSLQLLGRQCWNLPRRISPFHLSHTEAGTSGVPVFGIRGQYRISAGVWVPAQPLDHRPERFTLRAGFITSRDALGSTFAALRRIMSPDRRSYLPGCQYRGRGSTRRSPPGQDQVCRVCRR